MTELKTVATELQRAMNALGSDLAEDGEPGPKTCGEALRYVRELQRERAKTIPVPSDEIEVDIEEIPSTRKDGSGTHRLHLGPAGGAPLVGATIGGKPYAARQDGGYLVGYDVSHHQPAGSVDWSGQDVAIVRAAYGATKDGLCASHVNSAKHAGVPLIGAYLFVVQHRTALEQLEAFRSVLKGLPLNVAPTIDLEWDSKGRDEKVDREKLLTIAKVIRDALLNEFGQCMVYTAPGFAKDTLGMPAWLGECPLWLAHYTTAGKPVTWRVDALDRWCGHQWRGAPLDANVWRSVPLVKEFNG